MHAAGRVQSSLKINQVCVHSYSRSFRTDLTLNLFEAPVSGRGSAEVLAFGLHGVVTLRNITSSNPQLFNIINDFAFYKGGWRTERHVRMVADITGDRNPDIVGFGEHGVHVSINNGDNTFSPARNVLNSFAFSAGNWRVEKHIRFLADLRGVGRCDIVGFGDRGVSVSQNNGGGHFSPPTLVLVDFGFNAGGWRIDRHLRFLADVTGSNRLDIVGFGERSVCVARNNGDGTFAPAQAVINDFCIDVGGWRVNHHPRFLADLTGDGKVDIIGCGAGGVYVSLNDGHGGFGPVKLVLSDFGTHQGWKVDQHPRFVADLTGNKCGDLIGFGSAGVYVALNNGNGTFGPVNLVLKDFGSQQGWSVQNHPRFVADLTGRGCADILGFGEKAVWVSLNNGNGTFSPVRKVTNQLAFNRGEWALDKTFRCLVNLM
ncbi:lectin 2 [Crepidotus variabilis]|uniref:Lectin 2 n=1 Tax=Crepidotus variabilis TaxID=179855 RepID=A0A9P6E7I4_9AGAR|nr:lectin 2 [Crepidotus variabilis]